MQNSWLIIADGEPLAKAKTTELAAQKSIMALDGALKKCLEYNIIPDLVLGDLDSLENDYIEGVKLNYKIPFITKPCQNSTDLEKALQFLSEKKTENVYICHATGWRLDHTLYNLRLLKRYHNYFKILSIVTEREKIYFFKDKNIVLSGACNQHVAILSFPCADITSIGLEYDMQNYRLQLGKSESVCNRLKQNQACIKIEGQALVLISHLIDILV